jgi:hypothetical protein
MDKGFPGGSAPKKLKKQVWCRVWGNLSADGKDYRLLVSDRLECYYSLCLTTYIYSGAHTTPFKKPAFSVL